MVTLTPSIAAGSASYIKIIFVLCSNKKLELTLAMSEYYW